MNPGRPALVTGATGAVGVPLVRLLVERGYRVRVLIRRPPEKDLFPAGIRVIQGDIGDRDAVRRSMDGVGTVFHLAAKLHVENPGPSLQKEYRRVNVEGTRRVMEEAARNSVRRVVFFSTICVYGKSRSGALLTEDSPLQPDSMYAETKAEGEELVRQAGGATVLRCAAVYGPGMKGNYLRLIQALRTGRFPMIDAGDNRRTLVYIRDLCEAAIAAAEHPKAMGETFNVTDGGVHTFREIINTLCDAMERPRPRMKIGLPLLGRVASALEAAARVVGTRPRLGRAAIEKAFGDIAVSDEKLQRRVGFRPQYGLLRGWRETIAQMGTR